MDCYSEKLLWEGYLRRKFVKKDEQVFEAVELTNGQQLVAIKIDKSWIPNSNRRFCLSRRDDLYSLGYSLVYLLRGSHSWRSFRDVSTKELVRLKEDTAELCKVL